MIFNSLTYLLLLAIVVLLYWRLPDRPRLWLIFLSSLVFYGFWRVEFLPVLLASVTVDYWVARLMPDSTSRHKKRLLMVSLATNLALLFYFKYLIFFADQAVGLANLFGAELDPVGLKIILPLGISFYTFQTISYTVDVYRGMIKPERDFVLFGCFITYFPQLVAGPILRAREVMPQLKVRAPFDGSHVALGLRRILYGLFLKVVLADNIAPWVEQGFSAPVESLSAFDVWTLAFLFGFQIYFDFSAYSHIALGSARLMGIEFPENFRFPYLASSPRDFWRRWHISLSSWIRDYLYLPLAGQAVQDRSVGGLSNATAGRGHAKALLLTWGIMGLWHGAQWTFVLWGLYHAMVILIYRMVRPLAVGLGPGLTHTVGVAVTLPVMMLGWVPFRAETIGRSVDMWGRVLDPAGYLWLGMRENAYLVATLLFVGVVVAYAAQKIPLTDSSPIKFAYGVIDTTMIAVMLALVVVFLRPVNQFIYFQF